MRGEVSYFYRMIYDFCCYLIFIYCLTFHDQPRGFNLLPLQPVDSAKQMKETSLINTRLVR